MLPLTFNGEGTKFNRPSVAVGDWVVVTRAEHARVGDVIEFTYPSGSTARAIKRVAATGGAVVELRDGELVVDGRPQPIEGEAVRFERRSVVVPAGHYYLLGDNHTGSVDSRSFGPIPGSDLVGTVRCTVPDPRLVVAVLLGALLVFALIDRIEGVISSEPSRRPRAPSSRSAGCRGWPPTRSSARLFR